MNELKDINLHRLEGNEQALILRMIESDIDLKNTFGGGKNTQTRIVNSGYSALIRNKEMPVGFVMIVYNERTCKFEIDMGVLKQHRKKGYGTRALDLLKNIITHNELSVEVQTKKNNKAAIQSIIKNGFVLCRSDKIYNYYILPEDSRHIK